VPEDVTTIRTARSTGSAGSFGTVTEAGSLLGTPAYMAPEQANGDIAHLDRRADVFGLGAILCEILTGKPPYVGRSSEEVRRQARLHQAELAEAEARARALEESKRRRLTLALAATVLLALTLGGGGWLLVKADREARQVALTRDVNDALNQATALRAQASSATTGGAVLFAQAREQAQRALALVENGPADAALAIQVRQLQAELDDEEKDRTLVTALDEARLAQAESAAGESRFASERAVPKLREAFRAYGLPAGDGEPKVAAERIRQRPAAVREAMIAALDEWDDLAGNATYQLTEPHRDWLRAVLAAAEPADGWTKEFRAALAEPDGAKRRTSLEHLATEVDVRQHPPRTLTRLARRLEGVEPAGTGPRYATGPAALALLRRAQRQYPADFWINENLGMGLNQEKSKPEELTEAVRFLTAAVALRPESPGAHLNLGAALKAKGQVDAAIACWRKALELDPNHAECHCNLGQALQRQGRFAESLASYRRGHELGMKRPGWRYPSAEWVRKAERIAAMEAKLPAFLQGELQPQGAAEFQGLAEICQAKKLYPAATRLSADAFAADPKLADDLKAAHRYHAACCAALAAAGQGEDAGKLDDTEKARLRKQALDWLRADLALRSKQLESGQAAAGAEVQQKLKHWQQDRDLAGVRNKDALAKLPAEERAACEKLWADVAALVKKAEEETK
jgi:serine/threonine-protein kinase